MAATERVFQTKVAATATTAAVGKWVERDANGIRSFLADGMLTIATLLKATNTEKVKTTTTCAFRIAGIIYTKLATDNLPFSGTSTINTAGVATTAHWGVFLVQINAAGTVSTLHGTYTSGTDQDYATEAAAIAALPAVTASNVQIGYVTVQGKASTAWTEATDDLTPAGDCTTATFYNLPAPATLPADL